MAGHLLIVFEDGRCIFIKRNLNSTGFSNLYDTSNIRVINNAFEAPITNSLLLEPKKKGNLDNLELISIIKNSSSPHELILTKCTLHLESAQITKADAVFNSKKISLPSRGLINFHEFIYQNTQCLALIYFSKVYILDGSGKPNNKNAFVINSQKIIDLTEIFNTEYTIDSKFDKRTKKLYVFTSENVGMIDFDMGFEE